MLLLALATYSLFSKNRLVQFMNLLTITFILINTTFFEIIVKWSYQNRYGLIVVPLFCISFGLNLNEILIRLKKKWLYNASFSFCLVYLVQFPNYEIDKYSHGADWNSIYAFFRNNAQKNSVAYTLFIQDEELWFLDGFMAFDFYPQQNTLVRKFRKKNEETFPDFSTYIIRDLNEKKEPSEIYFLHNRSGSKLKLNAKMFENQNFKYFDINNFDLIRIKNTNGLFKSTLRFYELVELEATHSFSYRNVYQGLLKLYIYDSNCKAAKQAYKVLLKIYKEKDKEYFNEDYRKICKDG